MQGLQVITVAAFALFAAQLSAETPVEVKLIAAIEEDRGWCLDLRGGQNNGAPIGGLHGHTCYAYNGRGPTPDQAFVMENITEKNEFRMVEFNDKCMTLYEPREGSFISMETCDGRAAQAMTMHDDGRISPDLMPELCLTMSSIVLPGGGGRPLHIMRDVSFEACDDENSELQRWELRTEWTGPQETTAARPFATNPKAAPPGPPQRREN
jgi:hypothetical protein